MTNTMNIEVREAREAGLKALRSLEKAREYLNSARSWGVFDILGGGLISTLVKHAKMESAQKCLEQAWYDLEYFRREVADVRLPGLDTGDFLTFADFFLDGFLADFMVQRRINETRQAVDEAIRHVEDVLRRLP